MRRTRRPQASTGKVLYALKTPYRDGTTQVAFDPVDFIAHLAALVPKPRVNLTRFNGVLAPNHRWRGLVTPAKRGKGAMRPADSDVVSPIPRHAGMTWAQRLKRVFNIDIGVCSRCGGSCQNHRLHRGAGRHHPDPAPSSREGTECPCPAHSGTAYQGATCHAVSFRRKRTPKPTSAKTPLKKPWHGLLRALVQKWTDKNCTITSANIFSGQSTVTSRMFPAQSAVSVRKMISERNR